jgi:hypothetical protein
MPALDIDDLNNLQVDGLFEQYPYFVETGTFLGESIFMMEPFFEKLHTIEIKQEFYLNAVTQYKGNKINFHFGDSSVMLKKVCETLDKPTLFFLDGHWSAGPTGRGKKDCPLYEELENIIKHCKVKCVIMIDDVRLFGKGPNKTDKKWDPCNWEDITSKKILDIVKDKLETHYYINSPAAKNDRMILHLK